MKKLLVIALLILSFSIVHAQNIYTAFDLPDNHTAKIFTPGTRVRILPAVEAEISDSLSTGKNVTVIKKDTAFLTIGERSSYWYQVNYKTNGQEKSGFIWGGNFCLGYRKYSGYDFLFGIPATIKKTSAETGDIYNELLGVVKVFAGDSMIAEAVFNAGNAENFNAFSFEVKQQQGLKNVQAVVRVSVSGAACGIPSYDQYFLFTNKRLKPLPILTSVSDADLFYYLESYHFPDKNINVNTIVKRTKEMEKDEASQLEKIKSGKKIYTWDGNEMK